MESQQVWIAIPAVYVSVISKGNRCPENTGGRILKWDEAWFGQTARITSLDRNSWAGIISPHFICQAVTVPLTSMQWSLYADSRNSSWQDENYRKAFLLYYYFNHLYFCITAMTFILSSVLVFIVKQQSYQLSTLCAIVMHALSMSYPRHIVLHSIVVLHV